MLTTALLNNLVSYWVLFYTSEDTDRVSGMSIGSSPEYITEKFDFFFKSAPNKPYIIGYTDEDIIDWVNIKAYTRKWGLNIDDFQNTNDYLKYLFTYKLIFTDSSYTLDGDTNDSIYSRKTLIKHIISTYNTFFTDYGFISDNDCISILHPVIRNVFEAVIESNQTIYRNLKVKELMG